MGREGVTGNNFPLLKLGGVVQSKVFSHKIFTNYMILVLISLSLELIWTRNPADF